MRNKTVNIYSFYIFLKSKEFNNIDNQEVKYLFLKKNFRLLRKLSKLSNGHAMKDFRKEQLEVGRPKINPLDGINFCLECLYADQEKTIMDNVAGGCSYEELIGVLLLARDEIAALTEAVSA
jgi:hypothetical protein